MTYFDTAVRIVRAGDSTPADAAARLIDQLTDDELLWLLDGDLPLSKLLTLPRLIKSGPIVAGALPRVGFPGIRFSDGPRGVVIEGSTCFPVTMMRGATWDTDLEEEVGRAMGREARAHGANYSGAVCINLLRHPAWGRAQETYGEDPVLLGRLGAALARGLRPEVMPCVKHFALNSMEDARFKVDVTVDPHALHEVYLPHFRTAVLDGGAASVMSAYNSVNGAFCGENDVLLTDILRDEWGFEGFVTSDWMAGTRDAIESLKAGMDIEMPCRVLRKRELPSALAEGRVSRDLVLTSARRIITTVIRHYSERHQGEPSPGVIAGAEHRALARKVAVRGTVLLKNEPVAGAPVLPLPPAVRRLAVIGRLADEPNTGDHGSSLVHPPSTCSPLQGLREGLPGVELVHVSGDEPARAVQAARDCDAVVLVVGMGFDDEGEKIENDDTSAFSNLGFPFSLFEKAPVRWFLKKIQPLISQFGKGGDREALTLHAADEQLIARVADANPRAAVLVIGGSAIIMESWRHRVPAIVIGWYPGMEGGRAIADILTGAEEPGGRLPLSIPTSAEHLPFFDKNASSITYDASWGQRHLDLTGHPAAFPFGFGLGYTTFTTELLDHTAHEDAGSATVRVENIGARVGSTVAQVYVVDAEAPRPVPQLVGFRRIELAPGQRSDVEVTLDLTPTRQRDPQTRAWSQRPGSWEVLVAEHSPTNADGGRPLRT